MPASPACLISINGGPWVSTYHGVDIVPGANIGIKLQDSMDVASWYLEVFGRDELSPMPTLIGVNPTTHLVDTPSTIAEFVSEIDLGRALIFRSTVITTVGPTLITQFALFTLTSAGLRVGAVGETVEGDPEFGWGAIVNPAIRMAGGGGGFTPGGDLGGTAVSQIVQGVQTVPVDAGAITPTDQYEVLMTRGGPGYTYRLARLTEDMILPAFSVTSFYSDTVSSIQEVGTDIVVPPHFVASYSQSTPYDAVTLRDTDNPTEVDVSATPGAFSSGYTFTGKVTYGDAVTFTLSATKDGFLRTRSYTITWVRRAYWFAAASPGAFPGTFTQVWVEGHDAGTLTTTKNRTFTVNAGAGEHIYYFYRAAYGVGVFWVGGFEGGFNYLGDISLTVNAVMESYRVYESVQVGLGSTQVTVTD
jgi:hypothetical protein